MLTAALNPSASTIPNRISDGNFGLTSAARSNRPIRFSPGRNRDKDYHGYVLRFETTKDFTDSISWTDFDPGESEVENDPEGCSGDAFDGQYIYFPPGNYSSDHHGEVLRFDTSASCGDDDHPYPAMDFNFDCIVDMVNFRTF